MTVSGGIANEVYQVTIFGSAVQNIMPERLTAEEYDQLAYEKQKQVTAMAYRRLEKAGWVILDMKRDAKHRDQNRWTSRCLELVEVEHDDFLGSDQKMDFDHLFFDLDSDSVDLSLDQTTQHHSTRIDELETGIEEWTLGREHTERGQAMSALLHQMSLLDLVDDLQHLNFTYDASILRDLKHL